MSRFAWTFHNIVAHPLSEVLWQLGLREWSQRLHDITVPQIKGGEHRREEER